MPPGCNRRRKISRFLAEKRNMPLALKRVKVYLKLIAIGLVAGVVLLVVVKNRENSADIWFFRGYEQVNVLWLILITAIVSVAGWWGIRKVTGVLREFREVRRQRKAELQTSEQRRLAQELAEREKRIDQKLRRSITEET